MKAEKYHHLDFSVHDGSDRIYQPVHWFQFADDAAIITSGERRTKSYLIALQGGANGQTLL